MNQEQREAYARRLDRIAAKMAEVAADALALARDMRAGKSTEKPQRGD